MARIGILRHHPHVASNATELELLVKNLPTDNIAPPETQNSLLAYVRERLNHSLLTYMTHVIRSTLNKDRLDSILEQLQNTGHHGLDETLVIMDWKMTSTTVAVV